MEFKTYIYGTKCLWRLRCVQVRDQGRSKGPSERHSRRLSPDRYACFLTNEDAVGEASRSIAEGICTRENVHHFKMWVRICRTTTGKGCNRSSIEPWVAISTLSSASGYERLLQCMACHGDAYKEGKLAHRCIPLLSFVLTNFCETVEINLCQPDRDHLISPEQSLEVMEYYGVVPEAWSLLAAAIQPVE